MKLKIGLKTTIMVLIFTIIIILTNRVNALNISTSDVKAKKGEEFIAVINSDANISVAQGVLKFDSSKLEYIETTQEDVYANLSEEGKIDWLYFDTDGIDYTNKFEFKFKVKEAKNTEIKLENLELVDSNGKEFLNDTAEGSRSIKIKASNNTIIYIAILFVILVLGSIFIYVNKKRNKDK